MTLQFSWNSKIILPLEEVTFSVEEKTDEKFIYATCINSDKCIASRRESAEVSTYVVPYTKVLFDLLNEYQVLLTNK
jgi:hypothetical protein